MIYVKDVERGLRFYRDMIGFKLLEDFRYEGTPVYARLRAPGGNGTIALIRRVRVLPFRVTESASTSRSTISTISVASSSKRAST